MRTRPPRSLAAVAELHPQITVLAPLLGTWTGSGSGEYPTIEAFTYLEEVTFGHVGKPFLSYSQRTRSEAGAPMHAETGYLRVPAAGHVELMLAHPTGITEIDEGTLADDGSSLLLELWSTCIGLTSTAKDVTALSRSIRVTGDELTYRVGMAAVGQPLRHHLSATLHRKDA
ncbi:peroxynitrite isomerase [Mycobacterium sp. ACS4331]|uniref:peroxynitrite isomerase n=1 Tax=Mycobacterium sp. ACS4331 TaxID=1834121 RepID=UPI0009EEA120|nr:FABP family protein [Mycobacterium sp. ACS4331]